MLAFTVIVHRDAVQKSASEKWGADLPILAAMYEPAGGIEVLSKRDVELDEERDASDERARLERTYGQHTKGGAASGVSWCEYVYGRSNDAIRRAMAGDFDGMIEAGLQADVPVQEPPVTDAPQKKKPAKKKPAA